MHSQDLINLLLLVGGHPDVPTEAQNTLPHDHHLLVLLRVLLWLFAGAASLPGRQHRPGLPVYQPQDQPHPHPTQCLWTRCHMGHRAAHLQAA